MRMSCNGCRVLRKGCSENCSIRSSLAWIESPESQANATVFLAKFYGRTGLVNLINAGPDHLRPAIFRSLLREACGRVVNPIYGSVGLLWSGSWQLCQAAVDAVLKGEAITPIATDTAANGQGPPIKVYDIRHISKKENAAANGSSRHRKRYKTRRVKAKQEEKANEASHDSSLSHQSEDETANFPIELELKLGIEPVLSRVVVPVKKRRMGVFRTCHVKKYTCNEDVGLSK
ncbi:hypothetical protein CARUB_v10002654mg [Capsella rubella]|uniref:LOB domain-containing protein n=1 Tax=Capsella rubella TaxID=81985 RepID=R0GYW3_9BRAS|nr:LOB domain-containing protein 41 [Capsella rubella]EOA22104.1 hypothetical protein CARUB_v10002654mg [Capsella rubella]